jgi:hypothetical protein
LITPTETESLVANLLTADIGNIPEIVAEIDNYRKWTDPRLRAEYAQASDASPAKLRIALALLPVDDTQVSYLCERMLSALPNELPVLIQSLSEHRAQVLGLLWAKLGDKNSPQETRLRAACALSTYDSDSQRWKTYREDVASILVSVNPAEIGL